MTPRLLTAISRLFVAEADAADWRAWAASGDRREEARHEAARLRCIAAEAMAMADERRTA